MQLSKIRLFSGFIVLSLSSCALQDGDGSKTKALAAEKPHQEKSIVIGAKSYSAIYTELTDTGAEPDHIEESNHSSIILLNAASEDFKGSHRANAKTTLVDGENESFDSLSDLFAALPDDDGMRSKGLTASSSRVSEEQRNVTVNAYIIAYKLEPDRDFHVILGSDNDPSADDLFFTVEISGLPHNEYREQLAAPRITFKEAFSELGFPKKYVILQQGVPVKVSGSLFFDAAHPHSGVIGPGEYKAQRVWEIHPVSDLTFIE